MPHWDIHYVILVTTSTIICKVLMIFGNFDVLFVEKVSHFLKVWPSRERLRLFRADLQEDGSFDEAIRGCDGVFHVSASMEFGVSSATQDLGTVYLPFLPCLKASTFDWQHIQLSIWCITCSIKLRIVQCAVDALVLSTLLKLLAILHDACTTLHCFVLTDNHVKTQITDPAIGGALNVLKSCLKASATVKRVVFTSSISTLTAKDSLGKWVPIVDESCQTPVDQVLKTKASGWVISRLQPLEYISFSVSVHFVKIFRSGVCVVQAFVRRGVVPVRKGEWYWSDIGHNNNCRWSFPHSLCPIEPSSPSFPSNRLSSNPSDIEYWQQKILTKLWDSHEHFTITCLRFYQYKKLCYISFSTCPCDPFIGYPNFLPIRDRLLRLT